MKRQISYIRPIVILLMLLAFMDPSVAQVRWQFETGGMIIGKPSIVDEVLFVAGGKIVYALDLDGEVLWRREVAGEIAAGVAAADGVVYVHSSAGLHALDDRGEPRFDFEHEDRGPLVDGRTWGWGNQILPDPWGWYRSAPLLGDGIVYFGSSDGVHAVSKDTGEALWQVPIGPVTADLAAFGDLIVVASWNDSIYGLEAATGKPRWRFRARPPTSRGVDWIGYAGFHLTPVVDGDRVFAGNRGTFFFSINASNGTEIWSSKVGSSWIGSPAVVTEDAVYYGLSDGMAVLGYEKNQGAQTLFFKTGALVFAQPGIHDGDLIVGTLSGHLFRIDPTRGQGDPITHFGPEEVRYAEFFQPDRIPEGLTRHQATAWSVDQMLTESNAILNLRVEDDTAYVATASGVLYAVDLASSK